MPANTSSTLHRIDECPDVMADACVGDDQGNLIFLSIWARDTAVQQFLARLTLGRDEQGLDQFHVITDQDGSVPVFIGNVDRLEKRITRAYRRTLFGSLSNVWLFDRRCVKPDKANASALALLPRDSTHRLDRLWKLVRDTCPLPLLDPWREPVLELLQAKSMLTRLPFALGPLEGHRLAIDVPVLTQVLGGLIRSGALVGGAPAPPRRNRSKRWLEVPSPDMHARMSASLRLQCQEIPMALMFPRLARNFVKNGYFPTDEPTLERALAALAPSDGPMCILDPCAGEGVAIAEAAHTLGREQVAAYAVEYDAERARHARQLVDRCIHGDLMDTLISRQAFGLLWLNPPYGDLSKDANGNIGYQGQGRARLEKLFYQRSLPLLQYGGVLIYIVPSYVLDAELVGWLTRHFAELRIYRAVETQFKQVVIFGRRVRQRDQASDSVKAVRGLLLQIGQGETQAEELPIEWPFLPYTVPASPAEPEHFYRVTMEPEQFADEVGRLQGLWPALDTHLGAAQQSLRPPARALSHWHLALALAAGAISGAVRSRTGRVLVVKGDTHKEKTLQTEYTERDDGSVAETRILTDKFVPVIRAWDMTPSSPTRGEVLTIR